MVISRVMILVNLFGVHKHNTKIWYGHIVQRDKLKNLNTNWIIDVMYYTFVG